VTLWAVFELRVCRYRPSPTRPSAYLPAYPGASGMQFVCPAHLEVAPDREYKLYIGDQTVEDCGAPCRKMFFTESQLGKYWLQLDSIQLPRGDMLRYFCNSPVFRFRPVGTVTFYRPGPVLICSGACSICQHFAWKILSYRRDYQKCRTLYIAH
jgi:hypothetical protein